MYNYKEVILNSLTMDQVLKYYGIEMKRSQFCCPFHNDKTPSAKAYRNSYYCFSCNNQGDLIQFVQNYFNLSFIEAMQKLNYNFALGLDFDNVGKEELKQKRIELEKQKEKRIKAEQEYNKKMIKLCDEIKYIEQFISWLKNDENPFEWENNTETITYLDSLLKTKEIEFEKNLK